MILKSVATAVAGLVLAIGQPAAANEAAAAAQITVVLSDQANAPATGDAEFSELFASWKTFDNGRGGIAVAGAPAASVAVPTGMPLLAASLTSGFGMRTHPVLGGKRAHKGVDLASPSGTPVYATADGYVAKAEWYSSYGNYIQIEHGGDLETRFGHLSGYAVSAGEHVTKGQLIGYVGSTGRSTGPHLHYEVRVSGEAVDPRPYLIATELALAPAGVEAHGGP